MQDIKPKKLHESDNIYINEIKNGDENCIKKIYDRYRNEFLKWAGYNYNLEYNTAIDIFQDSMVILYENIVSEKLTNLTSSLKTYLFSIAKNQILKRNQKESKLSFHDQSLDIRKDQEILSGLELSDRQYFIKKIVDQMGEPCKSILKMYYFNRYPMDVIAARMKYKNSNVVKSQKLRCLNDLKLKLTKQFSKDEI